MEGGKKKKYQVQLSDQIKGPYGGMDGRGRGREGGSPWRRRGLPTAFST